MAGIEVFTNLQILDCSYLGIESIDLSAFGNLENLNIENNRLNTIDLSHNSALKVLNCSNNPLTSLKLDSLVNLEYLICDNTGIKTIDLSQNTVLKEVNLDGCDLAFLDLSGNSVLSKLSISNTTLGYLTLPFSGSMTQITGATRQDITYKADHDSFKITDIFPGIDVSKIEDMSGADIIGDTISGYTVGSLITYRYKTGKLKGSDHYLDYRIDLTINNYWIEELSISDIQYGDRLMPDAKAMYGTVEFLYSDSENGDYTPYKPSEAGTYYCKATVKGNSDYTELVSDAKEFRITQAQNTWTVEPAIEDADYETVLNMSGKAKFGKVRFVFASDINGPYDDELPIEAGQYYAKAIVDATVNYQGLESSPISFKINEAANYWLQELTIDDWTYGEEPAKPQAVSRYGNVTFGYSQDKDGMYSSLPSDPDAGIWYVKAVATGSYSYNGLASEPVAFEIRKAKSSITIDEITLDKVYDGLPVNEPLYSIEGSSGGIDVRYEIWKNDNWSAVKSAPSMPGRYRVIITLAEDKNYLDASATMEFIISKLSNEWTIEPAIEDIVYGEKLDIRGDSLYGETRFFFAQSIDGVYEETIPTVAGTWYAKAVVFADDIHEGISKIISFKINKAVPVYELPVAVMAYYGDRLSDIALPSGFIWHEPDKIIDDVGELTFMACYVSEDTVNYHIVENIKIDVTVNKAFNRFLTFDASEMIFGDDFTKISVPSRFGEAAILFSLTPDGIFTANQPDRAGIWYIKAIVKENDYYYDLESEAYPLIIKPRELNENEVEIENFALSDLANLTIKYRGQLLEKGQDYELIQKEVDGGWIIDITFKGNYQGIISKIFSEQNNNIGNNASKPEKDQVISESKDETDTIENGPSENDWFDNETEQSKEDDNNSGHIVDKATKSDNIWIIAVSSVIIIAAAVFILRKIKK